MATARHRWRKLLFLILAGLGLLTGWQGYRYLTTPSATEVLPANTIFLARLPHFPTMREHFQESPLAGMVNDPQVHALLAPFLHHQAGTVGIGTNRHAETIALLRDTLQGEVFVAVTGVSLLPRPRPRLVFGANLKSAVWKTRLLLLYHQLRLRRWAPDSRIAFRWHAGQLYQVWNLSPQRRFCYAFCGSLLLVTTHEDDLRQVLDRRDSLADNPDFRAATAGWDGDIHSYLNLAHINATIAPLLALTGRVPTLPALGNSRAIAMSTKFKSGSVRDETTTLTTDPPPPVARHSHLAFTAPDTLFYNTHALDWPAAYEQFLNLLATTGPPRWLANVTQFDRQLRRQDLRPKEDFFSYCSLETTEFARWRPGARWPDVALAITLKEPAIIADRLPVLLAAAAAGSPDRLTFESQPAGDTTYHTVRIGDGLVSPTAFVIGSNLVVASSLDFAREIRATVTRSQPTLLLPPDSRDAVAVTLCDLPAVAGPLLESLGGDIPFPLRPYLRPYSSVTTAHPGSRHNVTISPFGKPATVALVAAAAYWLVQPDLAALTPLAPKMFSDRAPRPAPVENPTATSQTPSRRPAARTAG